MRRRHAIAIRRDPGQGRRAIKPRCARVSARRAASGRIDGHINGLLDQISVDWTGHAAASLGARVFTFCVFSRTLIFSAVVAVIAVAALNIKGLQKF